MLPNFLICGAMKAGTTSLYHYLSQHPDVGMSSIKEVCFFAGKYKLGQRWYEEHFADCGAKKAIGEACPQYISNPHVPERIAALIPDAKLIFLLRDPVARAYSHYTFDLTVGMRHSRPSFAEVIRTEAGYRRYVKRGFYHDQLRRFLAAFPRSHLHWILTERLAENPAAELRACFELLQIQTSFLPRIQERRNVTGEPRGVRGYAVLRLLKDGRNRLLPIVPPRMERSLRPLYQQARQSLLVTKRTPPPLGRAEREYLREIYRLQNERLSNLLGEDLTRVWT